MNPPATTALPAPPAEAGPLDAFFAEVEPLPWQYPRRFGLALIQLGMATTLAMLPVSVVMMHIGFWTAMAGALLARPPLHRLPGFWIGVAFAAWQAWSVVTTVLLSYHPNPMHHWGGLYTWLALYLATVAFANRPLRQWAVLALLVGFAATTAVAAAQFCIGFNQDRPPWRIDQAGEHFIRASGLLGGRMPLGVLASLLLVVMIYGCRAIALRPLAPWLGGALAAIALVMSGARMAWVGCAAGASCATAAAGRGRWLRSLGAGIAILGVAFLAVYARTPEKIAALRDGYDARISIWKTSISLIGDHPLIGFGGREAFQSAYIPRWQQLFAGTGVDLAESMASHAHNSFLALAVEHGIPTALFYSLWLIALARFCHRRRRAQPDSWQLVAGLLAAWLVASQFENIADQSGCAYAGYLLLSLGLGQISSSPTTTPLVVRGEKPHSES